MEEGGARLRERPLQVELPLDVQLLVLHDEGKGEPVLTLHVLQLNGKFDFENYM